MQNNVFAILPKTLFFKRKKIISENVIKINYKLKIKFIISFCAKN